MKDGHLLISTKYKRQSQGKFQIHYKVNLKRELEIHYKKIKLNRYRTHYKINLNKHKIHYEMTM